MSQVERRWLANHSVDNSKVDNDATYNMGGLALDHGSGNLFVGGDSSMAGMLTVDGTANFHSTVNFAPNTTASVGNMAISGKLAVGTSAFSPSNKVTIRSVSGDGLEFNTADSSSSQLFINNLSSLWNITSSSNGGPTVPISFFMGLNEKVRIDTTGNVGIGTIPSYKLDVNGQVRVLNIPAYGSTATVYLTSNGGVVSSRTVGQVLTDINAQPFIVAGTTGQYWRGDKTWQTFNPAAIGAEPAITAGTTGQYWRGDKSWQTLNTTVTVEGTQLYFTDARARTAVFSSLSTNYLTKYNGTNLSNSIIIDNGTNVGIGTASPALPLSVVGNPIGTIRMQTSPGTAPRLDIFQVGIKQWGIVNPASTTRLSIIEDGADERVTFLSGGNVGIGTINPTSQLHVYRSAGNDAFLKTTSGTNEGAIGIGSASPTVLEIDNFWLGGSIVLKTGPAGGSMGNGTVFVQSVLDGGGGTQNQLGIGLAPTTNLDVATSQDPDGTVIPGLIRNLGWNPTGGTRTYNALGVRQYYASGTWYDAYFGMDHLGLLRIEHGSTGGYNFTVNSSGNIGIGTRPAHSDVACQVYQLGTNRNVLWASAAPGAVGNTRVISAVLEGTGIRFVAEASGNVYCSGAFTGGFIPGDFAELCRIEEDAVLEEGTVVEQSEEKFRVVSATDPENVYGIITNRGQFLGNLTGENVQEENGDPLPIAEVQDKYKAQRVALCGHVLCKVTGNVNIKDRLILSDIPGVARTIKDKSEKIDSFAIARQSYSGDGVGVIEVRLF